jgi:hypothetical protein
MKKFFILPLLASMTALLTGCGSVDVVDYNNDLVALTEKCFTAESLMRNALDQEDYTSAKTLYTTALETCASTQKAIAALEAFDNDSSLKDAATALLQAENDYLIKFGETLSYREYETLTPEQETAYATLQDELAVIEEAISIADTNLITVQEVFAAKHGYELEETSLETPTGQDPIIATEEPETSEPVVVDEDVAVIPEEKENPEAPLE